MEHCELSSKKYEADPLSEFLQKHGSTPLAPPDADKIFRTEITNSLKNLGVILENLHIPDETNFLNDWTTAEQVMQKFGISERTLANWRKTGKLPYSHIEKKFFYKKQDLESLLSAGYQKKGNPTAKL
jgi:hypothetical protein